MPNTGTQARLQELAREQPGTMLRMTQWERGSGRAVGCGSPAQPGGQCFLFMDRVHVSGAGEEGRSTTNKSSRSCSGERITYLAQAKGMVGR